MGRGPSRPIEERIRALELRIDEIRSKERQRRARAKSVAAASAKQGAEEGLPRFSAKWLASHRSKLGLSAANYGELVGVTGLTIYNWEKGRARPRAKQLAALASVRGIGLKEARQRLDPKPSRRRAKKA